MEKVIYLITSGEYSDYEIHAAYLKEEEAETACKTFNLLIKTFDVFHITTVPLGPTIPTLKDGFFFWVVRFYNEVWAAYKPGGYTALHTTDVVCRLEGNGAIPDYYVTVIADSEERAIKAGAEQINKYRALQGTTHR